MGKYKDLVNINTKKFELLKQRSLVNHQYVKNIYESGAIIESEIRKLFNQILPSRYRATHGYIADASSKTEEPKLSPQVDLIIVDNFVPNTLYRFDDSDSMELIPKEAVVGIFEIKRTLNKDSLLGTVAAKGAIDHLHDIIQSVGISKTNTQRYLPGGLIFGKRISGGFYSNPIIGIIGLETTKNMGNINSNHHILMYHDKAETKPHIDIITSFGDFVYVPTYDDKNMVLINPLEKGRKINRLIFTSSRTISKEYIISIALGYILLYVNNSCGHKANLDKYYLNEALK